MELYEIVNPSDQYTFYASEDKIAVVAVSLMNTAYGVSKVSTGKGVGPCLLFVKDAEKMLGEYLGEPFQDYFKSNIKEIIHALSTVLIGSVTNRRLFEEAVSRMSVKEYEDYKKKWEDSQRTSMNDIGARVKMLVQAILKGYRCTE